MGKQSKQQHVVPHKGQWGVKPAGGKVTKVASTQAQAIEVARQRAINQGSEVVIHRPNGQIRDKNSYGNDPFPPKG